MTPKRAKNGTRPRNGGNGRKTASTRRTTTTKRRTNNSGNSRSKAAASSVTAETVSSLLQTTPVGDQTQPGSADGSRIKSLKPGDRRVVPVLPVRHTVLFPFAILPMNVGRPSSVQLLHHCMASDRMMAVIAQKDTSQETPGPDDLHPVGTLAVILRMLRTGDNQFTVLVQGIDRIRPIRFTGTEPFLSAEIEIVAETVSEDLQTEALAKTVVGLFERVVALSPTIPDETVQAARDQSHPGRLCDFIGSLLDLQTDDKQKLLEAADVSERLQLLAETLQRELQVLEVGQQIQQSVRESVDQHQKEFILRQQMDAIRKELGETDESQREMDELKEKIEKANMPPEVRKEADRELARLGRIPPQAAEYTVSRTYLEWLCDMPWTTATEDNLDLKHVREVLDQDHYGLDKIKERILEYLVVRRFKHDARTPILCFAGPPGTGKTSLGRSIARALGRKFVRVSLGGVRDEAEIRGHRRTYIGALPGNIIQNIRRAGTRNPLMMLDEIDKLGTDFRGDPSSALLEVLDPEQNVMFVDHYLDVPFDLSQVLFVTTANYLDPVLPGAARPHGGHRADGVHRSREAGDREAAPDPEGDSRQRPRDLGLEITDDAVLRVAREYTAEAGLRNLEREIANLLRRTAKKIAEEKPVDRVIGPDAVRELLGPPRFEDEKAALLDQPGAALGLAWTPSGGEVLTIEATAMPGRARVDPHGAARRRDEGIGDRGAVVHPLARRSAEHRSADLRAGRHPRARAGGRDPQGRAVRGRRAVHGDGEPAHDAQGAPAHRDDGRDHAARHGAQGRRHQREGARRASRRHPHGDPARVEPGRSRGGADRGAHADDLRAGRARRAGDPARARAPERGSGGGHRPGGRRRRARDRFGRRRRGRPERR
jgi:ATP-dependent Lon protease